MSPSAASRGACTFNLASNTKQGSPFGAWLDHTTDMVFGVAMALSGLLMIYENIGVWNVGFAAYLAVMIAMGALGSAAIRAKEDGKPAHSPVQRRARFEQHA